MTISLQIDDATKALLSGTAAADADGNPLVLHHGTVHRFDRFSETVDLGFHFGSREQAVKRLDTMPKSALRGGSMDGARVVSVALAVKKPLLFLDDPGAWAVGYVSSSIGHLLGRRDAKATSMAEVRDWMEEAGYDALVYRNMVESRKKSRCIEFSWLVLRPEQIVMLGEDVREPVVPMPDRLLAGPGFDPEAVTRQLGGLRFANGGLQFAADRKAFKAAAINLMAELLPGVEGKDPHGWGMQWASGEARGRYQVEVNERMGRIRFSTRDGLTHDEFEGAKDSIVCDYASYWSPPSVRPGYPLFSCEWVPGESMGEALARSRSMIEAAAREVSARADPVPSM